MNSSPRFERLIFLFALWTVATHLAVVTASSLYDLLICFTLLTALSAILARSAKLSPEPFPTPEPYPTPGPFDPDPIQKTLFGLLIVLAVLLTLTAHRPDMDDALYVNLAVAAADAPGEVVQWYDQQHATEQAVLVRRASRLSSLSTLAATASWLTGIPAIYFFHLVFAAVAAVAVLFANREVFRILAPKYWAFGVLAVIVVLTADGEVHRTYGNFSFVRLHQGKGVLLSVYVPLLIAYGIRFAQRPSPRGWLLLTAAQVAATGCSSTGLLLGPVVANLAVIAGSVNSTWKNHARRLACSLLGSLYVLALVAWARDGWIGLRQNGGERLLSQVDLGKQVDMISASGFFAAFQVFILLTAWYWCRSPMARRLCLLFPSLLGLFFLNSVAADKISTYLIPVQVYWRVFWIVPWPIMAGLVMIAPLLRSNWRPSIRYGLYTMGLILVLALVSRQSIYSPLNGVEMRIPGLKVPAEYAIARRIAEWAPERPNVLVHPSVSAWLPTLHQHPYPLVSRYLYANRSHFGDDLEQRLAMKFFIDGRKKAHMRTALFQQRLDHYGVALVSFHGSNRWRVQIRAALLGSGFERIEIIQGHEIWLDNLSGSNLP